MKKLLLLIIVLFVFTKTYSQQQLTNSGNIKMHAGANLVLHGDFKNNGVFTDSGLKVLFMGNSIISGTSSTTFNNLELNNSSGINLQQSVQVNKVLTLTSGPLSLNSATLTITNNSPTAIVRSSGYIVSEQTSNLAKVKWKLGNVVNSFIIPFGTATGIYIPVTIALTSGDIGYATVSTYTTAFDNSPYPITPVAVTHMNNYTGADNSTYVVDRFWQINKDSTGGTVSLTFTATASEVGSLFPLRAQQWNTTNQGWDAQLPGQSAGAVSVTVPGVTSMNAPWVLSTSSNPLPVELLSFNATGNKNIVDVNWETATEINNDFFEVERSADGIYFELVTRVTGAGNSSQVLHYQISDIRPFYGVSYYRLKQTDYDGMFQYSQIRKVEMSNMISGNIYPNPVIAGHASVHIYGNKSENIVIDMYDSGMKKIYSKATIFPETGISKFVIDTPFQPAKGIYFITVMTTGIFYSEKLIVF